MCRMVRWNPFNVSIDHNTITDEREYWYRISNKDRKSIVKGKKSWIERTPWIFIEAVKKNKQIKLDTKNLYHMKRPTIADNDMSWGMPIILPVIKDAYWLQILRKANEAISLEHIVPWRILFPAANAEVSPYVSQNLSTWKSKVEVEVKRWRQDPNHISIMPIPIGTQNFGGDAKLLQVWQEEKVLQQQIAGGIGVPIELVFGGLSWSGSSVSLRILENHFIRDREEIDGFLNQFLIPNLQRYFRLTKIEVKQKNFKMADDVQQKQLLMQMVQMGKVSDTTMMEENDLDFQQEATRRMQEQNIQVENQRKTMIQQAELQGAVAVLTARFQATAQAEGMKVQQQLMPQPMMQPGMEQGAPPGQGMEQGGAPGGGGMPPGQGAAQAAPPGQPGGQPMPMAQGGLVMPSNGNGNDPKGFAAKQANLGVVKSMVGGIQRMDEPAREMLLSGFEVQNPALAKMIRAELKKNGKPSIDMRPLPEKNPPRRATGPI
jgi:hypothetical protein